MVQLSSLLATLAISTITSAVPITLTFGDAPTSNSLTISDDGSVSLNGQTIGLNQGTQAGGKKSCHGSRPAAKPAQTAKAIYFITNAAENSIVALNVAANGTLSDGSITATGGVGMTGIDAKGAPAEPDALFSQGAVEVSGQNIFAVNPGSNTLSMFAIDSTDPTKLTMIGQPADTLGEFPMSVAVSTKLNMACVANSGAKAGVACFSTSSKTGLTPIDTTLRAFDINQTTPPKGPTNTVSQTFFNADSTALMTTVKGDPAVNNTGFLSVFPVSANGTLSDQETRSSPAGTAVLFGTALIPSSPNSLFVTDAAFGSATLSLDKNNVATVSARTDIKDQAATCWATFSDSTGTAFVTDVAVNHLVEVDTQTGQLIKETNLDNGNPGMIDLVSAGKFVYALSPGNASVPSAVTVFDVSGGRGSAKQIQNFSPQGVTATAQGMTFV